MAKPQEQNKKTTTYPYVSRFGSHKAMLVKELEDNEVVLKDEFGEYKTQKYRLDDGAADPNRWDLNKRKVSIG